MLGIPQFLQMLVGDADEAAETVGWKKPNDPNNAPWDDPIAKAQNPRRCNMRAIVLVTAMMIAGCTEADVISRTYKYGDGRTAFIVDRYRYGFSVRGPDEGGDSSLDVLEVNQCKGGQLWWDGRGSLVFRYDAAEISYLADVGASADSLSIAACRNINALCSPSQRRSYIARIPISCG